MELFGTTRTVVAARHALIAEDGHVPSIFPDWEGATGYVMISPAMGSSVTQMLIRFDQGGGTAKFPSDAHEHAIYLETGSAEAVWDGGQREMRGGDFIYLPPETCFVLKGDENARITLFRKRFERHPGLEPPPVIVGNSAEISDQAFLGNEKARLKVLLPDDARFDLAMNIFTYQPGATLPFVETHIMEHGLLMLSGQGVYRLEECYYPVRAGDVIWMAPYCPQWFVAMGDYPASYLYYKNINRLP
ncbi:(S)-ureidoglycine aminohydrolase [Luteolibacter pohnpeiensis]|uniref:(S)-ureidoglycine aminohydrolase n=1 Tax=Luteolibacter pohnpeiensis TaxID=454153 RepID=A0A934S5S4_9BACT|nr:(S)-ureidoglycine aminohydrolase [Luteolibacter pohnpeiensis]MBK1881281.1 (S)-ureidoglycine aminohydrolase [Luteolibacter pohnpeiensis]